MSQPRRRHLGPITPGMIDRLRDPANKDPAIVVAQNPQHPAAVDLAQYDPCHRLGLTTLLTLDDLDGRDSRTLATDLSDRWPTIVADRLGRPS